MRDRQEELQDSSLAPDTQKCSFPQHKIVWDFKVPLPELLKGIWVRNPTIQQQHRGKSWLFTQ